MSLLQIQGENFFYQTLTPNKPNFVYFLVFVGTAASFTTKISSFETIANEKPFWISYQNSEYPRIFGVTGANQNVQKLLSTDLGNTNMGYFFLLKTLLADEKLCLSEELYSFLSPSPEHLKKQR